MAEASIAKDIDTYVKDEFSSKEIDIETTNVIDPNDPEIPTEEELRTLVRVADELPWVVVWCIWIYNM